MILTLTDGPLTLIRSEWIGGTEFTRGDYAIAVKWWAKTTTDPEERTFEEWKPSAQDREQHGIETNNGHFFILNSTELRLVDFPMDAVDQLQAPQGLRVTTRRARSMPERPSTAGRNFRLPADVENQILAMCW